MVEELISIWSLLEHEIQSGGFRGVRVYRRLDLSAESGLRLGIIINGGKRELLVQIDESDEYSFAPPDWVGMGFEIVSLDVPRSNSLHISLCLEKTEHEKVFNSVCSDIAESLAIVDAPENRARELKYCLERWDSFFKKSGPEGLSHTMQQGLYGELTWLEFILENSTNDTLTLLVKSWKGCERAWHDFQIAARVVEVKSTATKEPRRIHINNERQLDERGLDSLFLYVLTLHTIDSGVETLPVLIDRIREKLRQNPSARSEFEKSLRKAGYLDIHAASYSAGYLRKKQESFLVGPGFPRLIDLPPGVGNLSYTVTLSACLNHVLPLDLAASRFIGGNISES